MMKVGLLGVVILLGATACTDDHFDIRSSSESGANTLWQNIQATPNLSSVAQILQRTKVMKSETDKGKKQTYAELLDQPQEFTAWLPKDGSFDAQSYIAKLDRADSLGQTGVAADSITALRLNYEVGNQFVRNHVARFNYASNTAAQQVRMLNGKVLTYNATEGTFNDLTIDASGANIYSSNGILHVLNGESPFAYNLYDFLAYDSRFTDYFADIDYYNIYEFSASQSTEGAMNENGRMEYVDSVFVRDNELLNMANLGNIDNEDSVYVSVFPTNAAYASAKEAIKKYFNYASSYNYDWSTSAHDFQYKNAKAYKPNTDSLSSACALQAILSYLTVSASNIDYNNITNRTTILTKSMTADSLLLRSGSYFYNPNAGNSTPNPIFGVSSVAEGLEKAEKASNGYVFPVDTYNIEPKQFYGQKMYEATNANLADVQGCSSEMGTYTLLTKGDNLNDTIDLGGLLYENYYTYFPVSGNSSLTIDFRLREIYSNMPYKISIVMLPNCVNINNIRVDNQQVPIKESPIFDALLLDDAGKTLSQVRSIPVNQQKAEKITLWESYTFPYCYQGLPNEYDSFPRLRLRATYPYQTRGKFKALSVGRLIIEPADTAESE